MASFNRILYNVELTGCVHYPNKRMFLPFNIEQNLKDVVEEIHPSGNLNHKTFEISVQCCEDPKMGWSAIEDPGTAITQLVQFGVKYIKIDCQHLKETTPADESYSKNSSRVVNAFNVLMSRQMALPEKKQRNPESETPLNRKEEMYNDVVDLMIERNLKFDKSTVEDESYYVLQIITKALWYVTNQHLVINTKAERVSGVDPIPQVFESFQGYNEIKRKKVKSLPMRQSDLNQHAQALYSLCHRPIATSSPEWKNFSAELQKLADCLSKYAAYLEKELSSQQERHSNESPARTVFTDCTVQHKTKSYGPIVEKYSLLNDAVKSADELEVVFFDEGKHLSIPFQHNVQRLRYFQNMHLSVPVDMYKYCPGGGIATIVFVTKVREHSSQADLLIRSVRVIGTVKDKLPEYHTRKQKQMFRQKLDNLVKIKPSIADYIYKEAYESQAVETQQRIRMIALGETGLVADLRELNAGQPSTKFDTFFEKLEEVIDSITAPDERRHGEAHLSEWISLGELIENTAEKCPEGTLIPSKSLVRLQFTPRNQYTHKALNFTSHFPVQNKIQRRQLRASHPDQHFCSAQFKYLREKAVELGEKVVLICDDDKAKIPVGNPGLPISTGVRGRQTIAPTNVTLVAADHDMHNSSLTPSVYLLCNTPGSADKSFVSGQVYVVVNDSVLQTSSPFRHTAIMRHILRIPKLF